ncbi:hypothetical protein THAOC_29211, partial [Thalassiosira oceanica]
KTKLSPKDRRKLRDRARKAKKREDPDEECLSKGGCNYNDNDDKEEEDDDDDFIVDDDDDNEDMRKRRAMMKMTTRFMTKRRLQDHAIYTSPRDQNDKTHLSRFTICFNEMNNQYHLNLTSQL